MNTEPKTKRSLTSVLLAIVLVAGAGLVAAYTYIEQREEQRLADFIVSEIKRNGGEASLDGLNYNLLQNTLELTGVKVAFTDKGLPQNYEVGRILLRDPNRSLALAVLRGKTDGLAGVQPLAEELLFEAGKSAGKGPINKTDMLEMQAEAAVLSVTGIGGDMDRLLPALAEWKQGKKFSDQELMVLLARSFSYARRDLPQGVHLTMKSSTAEGTMSLASITETNYADCSLERAEMRDLRMDVKILNSKTQGHLKLTQDSLVMERLFISPKTLEMTLDPKFMESPDADTAQAAALFLGEKPFLGAMTLTDTQVEINTIKFKWDTFRYENTAVQPFTASVALNNLRLPSAMVISNSLVRTFLNMDELTITSKASVVVPVRDKTFTDTTTLNTSLDVAELGSITMDTQGKLVAGQATGMNDDLAAEAVRNFLASKLVLSYTDAGLVARGMGAARHTMGLDIAQLTTFLLAAMGSDPAMSAQKDKFAEFLAAPGTITMSITPQNPMPLEQLLELKPGNEAVKLEVTKGSETLDEQLKKNEQLK